MASDRIGFPRARGDRPPLEMLAEGWAEYLNNPSPRPMAVEIGEFILKTIGE